MPLDGFMKAGFFTELGQPFCSRISGNPNKIVNKYQAKDMTSYVRRRIPDGMSYPCKRRRRNAIAHVVMSSIISSSLASQELQNDCSQDITSSKQKSSAGFIITNFSTCISCQVWCKFHRKSSKRSPSFPRCPPCEDGCTCHADTRSALQMTIGAC